MTAWLDQPVTPELLLLVCCMIIVVAGWLLE
jgi:hypothetical protein